MRAVMFAFITALVITLLAVPECDAAPCDCTCQKALPERKCNEDDVTYYKRIFHVDSSCENNVKKFYDEVFYQYKGEGEECYVKRIDYIFTSVYSNLDCRCDVKRQQYLDKYYQFKYCKKSGENDESYFERVLTKTCESEAVYKSKTELLKKFVKKVDWSKVKIEEKTKKGFTIIKKSEAKSIDSCGSQKKKKEEEKKKKEAQAKKSENSCGCKNKENKSSNSQNNKAKESNNNNKQCGCQEKQEKDTHNKNEAKIKKQQNEHCNNENNVNAQQDTHNKNVGKIQEQNQQHECNVQKSKDQQGQHEQNVNKVCEQNDVHNKNVEKVKKQDDDHKNNVEKGKCQKAEHEKNEKTIATQKEGHDKNVQKVEGQKQEHCENEKKIEAQQQEHGKNVKKIEGQQVEHDKNVKCVEDKNEQHNKNVEKVDEQKKAHEENVKKWIKNHYCRKSGEDDNTYYKRITCQTGMTTEEFVERITMARRVYSTLDVWYSEKYLYLTKGYYTLAYQKKTTETEDAYYERLLYKESYESDCNWAKRIHLLHVIFVSSSSVWYEEQYYEKITKKFYQIYYKKEESESNEVYLKRVFAKIEGECEENYWKRIKLIEKTFPDYTCWSDKKSLEKIDSCKCLSEAKSEEDLKKSVKSQKSSGETDECSKAKLECLQVVFKSTKSSSKTSETTTEEQESSSTSKCNA